MLGVEDSYIAYCIDEAGAFLMRQKEPPHYGKGGKKEAINRNKDKLRALAAFGAEVDI